MPTNPTPVEQARADVARAFIDALPPRLISDPIVRALDALVAAVHAESAQEIARLTEERDALQTQLTQLTGDSHS